VPFPQQLPREELAPRQLTRDERVIVFVPAGDRGDEIVFTEALRERLIHGMLPISSAENRASEEEERLRYDLIGSNECFGQDYTHAYLPF
jgi:hypothetical protein